MKKIKQELQLYYSYERSECLHVETVEKALFKGFKENHDSFPSPFCDTRKKG